ANSILGTVGSTSPVVILAVIYTLTLILSEFLSNNATAAMMGSLAIATASQMNVSPRPFLIAVTVAASCAFASPIGYQTNLMVLNAGGY
ncbi:SLC13 family permease, partial [Salmonella enterica]|uniref:SLC13 family permease n=1 Tax=Salmonella enterica TaxID=28901 RepID=UPI003D2A2414